MFNNIRREQGKEIKSPKENKDTYKAIISLVSGSFAGVICSIICSPLDVAKVRMQVQGSLGIYKYKKTFGTIRTIIKEEGIRGCFWGLGPTLYTVPL